MTNYIKTWKNEKAKFTHMAQNRDAGLSISMTVGTTFPCKILNNGKEPCEPL